MLESVVVIPVLLTVFAAILQYAYVAMASMLVQHAAVIAARSAIVVIPNEPFAYGDHTDFNKKADPGGDRYKEISDAASSVMKALQPLPFNRNVNTTLARLDIAPADSNCKDCDSADPEGYEPTADNSWPLIKVTVTYAMKCQVPFGGSLICGPSGELQMTAAATMQLQGAQYGYF